MKKVASPRRGSFRAALVAAFLIATIGFPAAATADPGKDQPNPNSQATYCSGSNKAGDKPAFCNSSTKGATGIPGDIANTLKNVALQKLAGFAFNQIGLDKILDSNANNLDALRSQLNQISAQLTTLQL